MNIGYITSYRMVSIKMAQIRKVQPANISYMWNMWNTSAIRAIFRLNGTYTNPISKTLLGPWGAHAKARVGSAVSRISAVKAASAARRYPRIILSRHLGQSREGWLSDYGQPTKPLPLR